MNGAHSKEYQDGFDAYLKNPDVCSNPHRRATKEFNEYERGWTQALKRYPQQKSSKPAQRRRKHVEQGKSELSPKQKAIRDAYRRLK